MEERPLVVRLAILVETGVPIERDFSRMNLSSRAFRSSFSEEENFMRTWAYCCFLFSRSLKEILPLSEATEKLDADICFKRKLS